MGKNARRPRRPVRAAWAAAFGYSFISIPDRIVRPGMGYPGRTS